MEKVMDGVMIPKYQVERAVAPRPLHNLADHPAEARIMLILSRFA